MQHSLRRAVTALFIGLLGLTALTPGALARETCTFDLGGGCEIVFSEDPGNAGYGIAGYYCGGELLSAHYGAGSCS